MTWVSAQPEDSWLTKTKALFTFLREVFVRNKFNQFTWDPPNVPANSTVDTTLTTAQMSGLRVGQAVYVSPPAALAVGVVLAGCWVAADDSLTIRLANLTGAGIDPAGGTWTFQGVIP